MNAVVSDVAIVGAGAAGITLALELAAHGVGVVLIEGGGREYSSMAQARYQGEMTTGPGMEYPPLDVWRLRQFGGTTNHWGGWCRPLETEVFGARPWIGDDDGWPLDASDLSIHLPRVHQLCGIGRVAYEPQKVLPDLGIEQAIDWGTSETVMPVLWRFSSARFGEQYGRALADAGVDVRLHADVVSFSMEGDAVIAVDVVDSSGDLTSVRAAHFAICCGGLESVRHLLHLAREHPQVARSGTLGVGFMEHPHGVVAAALVHDALVSPPSAPLSAFVDRVPDVDGVPVRAGLALTPEVCRERGLMNMSFTLDPGTQHEPHSAGVSDLLRAASGSSTRPVGLSLYARTEQRPHRESTIALTHSFDDRGMRRIRLDWRVRDTDLEDIGVGVGIVARAVAELGIGVVRNSWSVNRMPITGGAHHLGGARMHEDAGMGVVDGDGRVHAFANLHVCSSATFPTSGFANPTVTVVALACRLAGAIARSG